MQEKFKQIFSKGKDFKLSPEERQKIKSSLILFLRDNPVRHGGFFSQLKQPGWESLKLSLTTKSMTAALLVITLLTGSTSVLAEGALPGMPLYPVKTGINEPIREFLSFSDDAKVGWSIQVAGRRLAEAEALASSGKLSSENRFKLEARFNSASDDFKDKIEKLGPKTRKERALELSSDFEAALEAHRDILKQLSSAKPQAKIEIEDLLEDVDLRTLAVMRFREVSEVRIATSPDSIFETAVEVKLKAVGNKIEEVAKLLSENKERFDTEAYIEAGAKLDEARLKINEGKIEIQEGKHVEAFTSFQEALRIAQSAKLLTSSAAELRLKIEGNKLEVELEETVSVSSPSSLEFDDEEGDSEDENGIRLRLEASVGINP